MYVINHIFYPQLIQTVSKSVSTIYPNFTIVEIFETKNVEILPCSVVFFMKELTKCYQE